VATGVEGSSSLVVIFAEERAQLKQVMGEVKGSLLQNDEVVVVNCGGLRATKRPFCLDFAEWRSTWAAL
jgi:hypothetical protein